jgi:hypothetical protein
VAISQVPEGIKDIIVTWKSPYNPEVVVVARTNITLDRAIDLIIPSTVYDADLKIVSPTGRPIANT